MKTSSIIWSAALITAIAATALNTQAQALNAQITLRALTPQDIKDYGLTGLQGASGLSAVGLGQPAYLEVLVNRAIAPTNITSVTWVLTNKPVGSQASLEPSPLGTHVPTFKVADQLTLQVAGRALLRPDIAGQYTVVAQVVTTTSGSVTLTQHVSGATYLGAYTCAFCHSGGIVAENVYTQWTNTLHARAFKDAINGVSTTHFAERCIACHVVGFDTNALAVNGGFDDIARHLGWTFPTTISSTNWDAMPPALQALANVQCESCHGPGSEHAYAFGNTNLVNWPRLGVSYAVGSCAQCHDSLNFHYRTAEWKNSRHAIATRTPSGAGRQVCVRCHTAPGFAEFINSGGRPYATNVTYEAITCAACHDPHDASNPHQLRAAPIYTLPEGTTVTNAGLGALCMQCHHSRNGSASNNVALFMRNAPTWEGGVAFGPHDSTAGDMVEGVNAIDYGKVIPSGSHSASISNTCVGCHMQPVAPNDPAFTKAGGHTFSMTYTVVSGGVTNHVPKVDVCVKCHGPMQDFNLVRKDYNGDGVIEGIQTEVQRLLDRLSTLLPNATYRADGNYVADGLVKTIGRTTVKTNWPQKFLNAAYNYMYVAAEGSRGIHNAPYAIGILKASIADLTGDGNEDGLPDAWQAQYFGSANAPQAAPNASPAGDGYPNWLKYTLGLDPRVPGVAVPGGVVWASGNKLGGGTNTIQIYRAAEISFDTEVGKIYQIQAISTLGGGWQNIGAPIPGTGGAISYVTPTRAQAQQYYRVVTQ